MKKLIISIIFLLFHNSSFSNEIVYLDIQYIIDNSDIGKFKVNQAKSKINKIYRKIKIKTYKIKISEKNIEPIIKDYDIICDGSDNFETRFDLIIFNLFIYIY